jgi:hypothetical protein
MTKIKELLQISDQIILDPVLIQCIEILFKIANEEGIKGKKLANLRLENTPWGWGRKSFICDEEIDATSSQ